MPAVKRGLGRRGDLGGLRLERRKQLKAAYTTTMGGNGFDPGVVPPGPLQPVIPETQRDLPDLYMEHLVSLLGSPELSGEEEQDLKLLIGATRGTKRTSQRNFRARADAQPGESHRRMGSRERRRARAARKTTEASRGDFRAAAAIERRERSEKPRVRGPRPRSEDKRRLVAYARKGRDRQSERAAREAGGRGHTRSAGARHFTAADKPHDPHPVETDRGRTESS